MKTQSNIHKGIILSWIYIKCMAFAFTGGNVTLPLLQKELDEKYHFMDKEDVLTYFALGQILPGTISLNTSIFIGYKIAGIAGVIGTSIGVIFPAFFMMLFVTIFFQQIKNIKHIENAIEGIRVASVAIIFYNAFNIFKSNSKTKKSILIMIIAFLMTAVFNVNIVIVILTSGILNVLSQKFGKDKVAI